MPDLIITPPTADGNPEPTVTLELTRDGADVLGEVSGDRITNALPGAYSATWRAVNSAGTDSVTRTATVEASDVPVIGGETVGAAGAAGTIYEGLRLIDGDDFDAQPTRWHGRNLTGRYAHSALSYGFRGTNPANDRAIYIDPAFRGARSQSTTDLGYDGVEIANGIATLTADPVPEALRPFLPQTYTNGRGDADNRPLLMTGTLKTAPSFMFSAQADFVVETRIRMEAGVIRGYWPSFWTTTFFWPDRGEIDIVEGKKSATTGAISSQMNLHASSTDGGNVNIMNVATVNYPADRWIRVAAKRQGGTLYFYDDAQTEGVMELRGSTTTRVDRLTGAHDIRLDLAVSTQWDGSTFDINDWPAKADFDWWRVWVPTTAAHDNEPTVILPAVKTTPGGSWAATIPAAADLFAAGAGLEQVTAAWDNHDAPGMPTRSGTTKLPTSMTVSLANRTVSGTVPTTEGGMVGLFLTKAYDDGSPVQRALLPFHVAPAVQSLPASWTVSEGDSVAITIPFEAFHSGNLGPHTYAVTAPGLTVTGNGTTEVQITGTASVDATITVAATNIEGQTTSVQRALNVTPVGQQVTLNDTFTGKANGTDLTAHTGEGGGTWARHPTAQSSKIAMSADGMVYQETADTTALYISSVDNIAANALITASITAKAFSNVRPSHLGVIGRCDPTAATFYMARVNRAVFEGPTLLQLYKSVNGTFVQLGSSVDLPWTADQNRSISLRMVGSTISAEVNGTAQITVTDTAISSAGRAGIRAYAYEAGSATAGFQMTSIAAQNL